VSKYRQIFFFANEGCKSQSGMAGHYEEELKYWKGGRGKIITEEFPKRAVLRRVKNYCLYEINR